jgi:hypothetical protein
MSDNIHYLHGKPREIAQFTRVGFSDHRQIEHLLSTGKMPVRRFVIEAGNYDRQSNLARTLRDENAEIVLDTNVAELSTMGRYAGAVRAAPWAAEGRPLEPDDFVPGSNRSVIEPIASFAVDKAVSTVMAPTHYLDDERFNWFEIDCQACIVLRNSLDRNGGVGITVDYPLIISYAQFRDPDFRIRLIERLRDVPFDYLWLRISGFGADATTVAVERYIRGLFEFHALGRPIIADQVGGLASLAVCAFGAASGFAHGVAGKERFSASSWMNPKPRKGSGGLGKTVYISGLDRRLKVTEAREMFNKARTSREIFGCPDSACCGDIERMLGNPEAHFMVQKYRQVEDLSRTPETARADRFLTEHVEQARRRSDRAMNLKKTDDDMKAKISKARIRLTRFEGTLTNLNEQLGPTDFAGEAQVRPSGQNKGPWGSRRTDAWVN